MEINREGVSMKENDLMIGDWVYLVKDYGPIKKEILKLDGLDLYRVFDGVLGVEPIPLTAEILKKNGFKHYITEEDSDSFDYTEGNLGYVFNKTEYGYMSCIDMVGSFTITGLIKYVHELQHIFRLCGLSERADNFKL